MPQNEANKSVAAVVVTHNRLELLRQCVRAIRKQSSACDILAVDNARMDYLHISDFFTAGNRVYQ